MVSPFYHLKVRPRAAGPVLAFIAAIACTLPEGCRTGEVILPVEPKADGRTTADSTVLLLYPSGSGDGSRFIGVLDPPASAGSTLAEADADSGRLTVIYSDSLEKRMPSVSPDGRRVAYLAAPAGWMLSSAHVWVVDRDGSDARDLTPHGGSWSFPVWSPDGRSVVFSGGVGDSGEIHKQIVIADAATGKSRLLTRGRFNSYHPAFLADNRRIVFQSDRISTPYGGKVFLMSITGGRAVPVDTSGSASLDPLPSPVRPEVLFYWGAGMEDARGDYMIDADSVALPADPSGFRLIHRENVGSMASWSPDGSSLHFLFANGSSGADLMVMGRDGSGIRALTAGYDIDPRSHAWSRDSRRILFAAREGGSGSYGNYICDVATKSVRKLKFAFK